MFENWIFAPLARPTSACLSNLAFVHGDQLRDNGKVWADLWFSQNDNYDVGVAGNFYQLLRRSYR